MNRTVVNIAHIDIHLPSLDAVPGAIHMLAPGMVFADLQPSQAADTVIDPATGLMWSKGTIATDKTWAEAKTAAAACRLGGHTDWRLPTRKELLTLVDDTRFKPAINTDLYQCDPNRYWSSTVDAESPSVYAWGVYFDYGFSSLDSQYLHARVRAVRSVLPSASGQ